MKPFTILISLLFGLSASFAQTNNEPFTWPIEGAPAGTNIISSPQGYIGDEFNFDDLFIGAPEGATVVSPVEGKIQYLNIGFYPSLTHSSGWNFEGNFDESIANARSRMEGSPFQNYIYGSIGIDAGGGMTVWISGLTGDRKFKTGQTLKKGEPLGSVGFSYHQIKEPSIKLTISQNSKSSDPMSPFGIRTTFIPPKIEPPVTSITKEKAKEDFIVYMEVLKETFPGLYFVTTEKELEEYIAATIRRIESFDGDLDIAQFGDIMYGAVAKIHDSHIWMSPEWISSNRRPAPTQPGIRFGWIQDTLVCTNAPVEIRELVGKQILSVNGMDADSMKSLISGFCIGYDMQADEYMKSTLAVTGFLHLFTGADADIDIVFADGDQHELKGFNPYTQDPDFIPWRPYMMTNWHPEGYKLEILNDSTAYIGITHFGLNQTQVEEIGSFINSVADHEYLIFDVRNNGGGNGEVITKIFSYIAQEPFSLCEYSKVNARGFSTVSKYSMNYTGMDEIFPDFEKVESKEGYYQFAEGEGDLPDNLINYKGKVYVLANEHSASAATLFPALVIKHRRGVVVGRETRTAYHQMVASKFADIRLPNSGFMLKVPLVLSVFDSDRSGRHPFGRGAFPDYHVPFTLGELNSEDGDAILNHTLYLIEEGKYLIPEEDGEWSGLNTKMLWIAGGAALLAATVLWLIRRRKRLVA